MSRILMLFCEVVLVHLWQTVWTRWNWYYFQYVEDVWGDSTKNQILMIVQMMIHSGDAVALHFRGWRKKTAAFASSWNIHIVLFAVHLPVGGDNLLTPPVGTITFQVACLATIVAEPFVGLILLLCFIFFLLSFLLGSDAGVLLVVLGPPKGSSSSIFTISGMWWVGGFQRILGGLVRFWLMWMGVCIVCVLRVFKGLALLFQSIVPNDRFL